jgi:hypothetical protein
MIGADKPKSCLKRWRKAFHTFGEDDFYTDRRVKGSTGSPSSKEETAESRSGLSKKVRRTRKEGDQEETILISEKFQLIEQTIRRFLISCMPRPIYARLPVSAGVAITPG